MSLVSVNDWNSVYNATDSAQSLYDSASRTVASTSEFIEQLSDLLIEPNPGDSFDLTKLYFPYQFTVKGVVYSLSEEYAGDIHYVYIQIGDGPKLAVCYLDDYSQTISWVNDQLVEGTGELPFRLSYIIENAISGYQTGNMIAMMCNALCADNPSESATQFMAYYSGKYSELSEGARSLYELIASDVVSGAVPGQILSTLQGVIGALSTIAKEDYGYSFSVDTYYIPGFFDTFRIGQAVLTVAKFVDTVLMLVPSVICKVAGAAVSVVSGIWQGVQQVKQSTYCKINTSAGNNLFAMKLGEAEVSAQEGAQDEFVFLRKNLEAGSGFGLVRGPGYSVYCSLAANNKVKLQLFANLEVTKISSLANHDVIQGKQFSTSEVSGKFWSNDFYWGVYLNGDHKNSNFTMSNWKLDQEITTQNMKDWGAVQSYRYWKSKCEKKFTIDPFINANCDATDDEDKAIRQCFFNSIFSMMNMIAGTGRYGWSNRIYSLASKIHEAPVTADEDSYYSSWIGDNSGADWRGYGSLNYFDQLPSILSSGSVSSSYRRQIYCSMFKLYTYKPNFFSEKGSIDWAYIVNNFIPLFRRDIGTEVAIGLTEMALLVAEQGSLPKPYHEYNVGSYKNIPQPVYSAGFYPPSQSTGSIMGSVLSVAVVAVAAVAAGKMIWRASSRARSKLTEEAHYLQGQWRKYENGDPDALDIKTLTKLQKKFSIKSNILGMIGIRPSGISSSVVTSSGLLSQVGASENGMQSVQQSIVESYNKMDSGIKELATAQQLEDCIQAVEGVDVPNYDSDFENIRSDIQNLPDSMTSVLNKLLIQ